jgi:hypothetical protein
MAFLYRWWRETLQGSIQVTSKNTQQVPVLVSEFCQTEDACCEEPPNSHEKESELQQRLDSLILNQMKGVGG